MINKNTMIKVNVTAQSYTSFQTKVTTALELCFILPGIILRMLFSCTLISSQTIHARKCVHREISVKKLNIHPILEHDKSPKARLR